MKQTDINAILGIHRQAFGQADGEAEGEAIAQLAKAFLDNPDTISISVEREGKLAGNVLFTPFVFTDHRDTKCYLLAPCGVSPHHQGTGVGKELMETSIGHLKSIGADAVFVLGVPTFYPRYGFVPTDKHTPYPDLLTAPEAWMALELTEGTVGKLSGKTQAIPQFMDAHWWDTSQHD
ncbi:MULTISPECIES: GNAT family N-acetyltransferase [Ruegeria]|uniref:GNAT family N-acetyltransferase n=1 Tax=Ruegeria TaxID=97050 RepID=UPI00147D9038|nr:MULTISPECIES: N-acetyltransferase [Ruegeria]NOE36439.1 GNAT family N-acetyltransferase [Ruegeria sp. HKCCD7318]